MSKKTWITVAIGLGLVAVGVWLSGKGYWQEKEKNTFRIGAILSLTGRGAKYGKAAHNGIELAVAEVNSNGGIQGLPVELIVEDSMSESRNAISAYKKLLDFDGVRAVIGPMLSDEVLAVAPVANRRKVLIIAPAAGTDKISEAGPYVFRNRESAMLQSEKIAQLLLREPLPQRIAILYSTTANAVSYKNAFMNALGDERKRIVLDEPFAEGQQSFRAVIAKLKSVSASHVFVPGLAPEIARILVQAREAGIRARWYATAGAFDQELLKIAGPTAEGLVFGVPALNTSDPTSAASQLNKRLLETYQTEVDMCSANAYDAVLMVAMAADKAKVSGRTIRDELESIKDFPGAGGTTTFINPGTVKKPITLMTVKNSEFIALD